MAPVIEMATPRLLNAFIRGQYIPSFTYMSLPSGFVPKKYYLPHLHPTSTGQAACLVL